MIAIVDGMAVFGGFDDKVDQPAPAGRCRPDRRQGRVRRRLRTSANWGQLGVTDEPGTNNPRDLRCSDVDRDRVAEALRQAAGDGRLTLSELEERLDAAFRARTYGDSSRSPPTYRRVRTRYRALRVGPPVAPAAGPRSPAPRAVRAGYDSAG